MGQPQSQYEVVAYKKGTGRCPTTDFLDGLQKKDAVFVERGLKRLAKHGRNKLGRPYVAYLRDNIWELRINIQSGICRLFFFSDGDRKYVITHGYVKKSGKVPDSEIDKAMEYRNDYFSRKAGN